MSLLVLAEYCAIAGAVFGFLAFVFVVILLNLWLGGRQ